MIGATVFFASVGPVSVQSNVSEWLELAGFENLPMFLVRQQVDQPITLIAFALFGATFVPWTKLIGRLFGGFPRGSEAAAQTVTSTPAPEPPAVRDLQPEIKPPVAAPQDVELLRAEYTFKAERNRKIAEAAALRKQQRKARAAEMIATVEKLRPKNPTPPGHYPMAGSTVGRITITNSLKGEGVSWDAYENEEIAKVKANALYCSLNTPEEIERFKTPEAKQEFYCNHARIDAMVRGIRDWENRDD